MIGACGWWACVHCFLYLSRRGPLPAWSASSGRLRGEVRVEAEGRSWSVSGVASWGWHVTSTALCCSGLETLAWGRAWSRSGKQFLFRVVVLAVMPRVVRLRRVLPASAVGWQWAAPVGTQGRCGRGHSWRVGDAEFRVAATTDEARANEATRWCNPTTVSGEEKSPPRLRSQAAYAACPPSICSSALRTTKKVLGSKFCVINSVWSADLRQ